MASTCYLPLWLFKLPTLLRRIHKQHRNLTRGFLDLHLFSFWRFRYQIDASIIKFSAIVISDVLDVGLVTNVETKLVTSVANAGYYWLDTNPVKFHRCCSELQIQNKLRKHIKNYHITNLYSLQCVHRTTA